MQTQRLEVIRGGAERARPEAQLPEGWSVDRMPREAWGLAMARRSDRLRARDRLLVDTALVIVALVILWVALS